VAALHTLANDEAAADFPTNALEVVFDIGSKVERIVGCD